MSQSACGHLLSVCLLLTSIATGRPTIALNGLQCTDRPYAVNKHIIIRSPS